MPTDTHALMLFAAGFGQRMQPLTQDRPKPLIEVSGKALIDHALDLVPGADIGRIVANTHYKSEMIADHLATKPVSLSHESPAILETGGGLRAALPLLGPDPVLALNPDAVWRGAILCGSYSHCGTRLKWMRFWCVSPSNRQGGTTALVILCSRLTGV